MKAIEIQNNSLLLGERPIPSLKPGELLIKVGAAGLNRADLFQVQGSYPPPPGASDIPGLEAAGDIVDMAEGVEGFQIGDKVTALLEGGGYAEYVAAPATQVLPIPAGLSLMEAAALPEACFTVWLTMVEKAGLTAGESVLLHAGASGIGTMAIQCAKMLGATVFVTAGSARKCAACCTLGADRAINYHEEDFVTVIQELTEGRGVRVIIDTIGGSYIARNLQCLAYGGMMISLAFLQGARIEANMGILLRKNLSWLGSTLRSQPVQRKAKLAASLRTHLWPAILQGKISPVVDRVFPFAEVAKAHRVMENNQNIGKIVLSLTTP